MNTNEESKKIVHYRDIMRRKLKKEELSISDYSLIFDHLIFDLYEIKNVLEDYKSTNDAEKALYDVYEIIHR